MLSSNYQTYYKPSELYMKENYAHVKVGVYSEHDIQGNFGKKLKVNETCNFEINHNLLSERDNTPKK